MPSISVTVPILPSLIGLGSSSILSHTIRIPTLTEESLHTNDFGALSGLTEYVSPMHDLNDTIFVLFSTVVIAWIIGAVWNKIFPLVS